MRSTCLKTVHMVAMHSKAHSYIVNAVGTLQKLGNKVISIYERSESKQQNNSI